MEWTTIIETIGWASTVLLVASFLLKERSSLHLVGFLACILKLIYTYAHAVWPLFVNWLLLLIIQGYQYFIYRKR